MLTPCAAGIAACTLSVAAVYVTHRRSVAHVQHVPLQHQATRLSVWCAGLVLWPSVWANVTRGAAPEARLGLLWPVLVMLYDTHPSQRTLRSHAGRSFNIDPNLVIPSTLAFAGIVGASANQQHLRVFVVPLLIMICVVLHRPVSAETAHDDDGSTVVISAVQRVAQAYCVGLIVSGVLYRGYCLKSA